jgi:PTS system fructose-specific IIA component/PTS system nitrogen regulatory IIA component
LSPASLIASDAVFDGLESTSKEGVLREMVDALVAAGRVGREAAGSIVEALLSREALGSTGIGRGIAVPHAKHESVQGLVAALGRSEKGIEFSALDGQPVHLVFLLLSSKRAPGTDLEALAGIAKLARDDHFHRFLRSAKGPDELHAVLQEAGAGTDAPAPETAGLSRGRG